MEIEDPLYVLRFIFDESDKRASKERICSRCGSRFAGSWAERCRPCSQANTKTVAQYGITIDAYDKLLAEQGGVCAICREVEDIKGRNGAVRSLSVDHCHETGAVRGLLCGRCNTGLGYFRDSPTVLSAACSYLARDVSDEYR